MGTKLTDTQTQTATGVYNPATMVKFPEGGATFSVSVASGTATCTVQLRAWNTSMTDKEILATFVLPYVGAPKAGDLFDSIPVYSIWDDWDWNVTAIGAGATVRLSAVGLGA